MSKPSRRPQREQIKELRKEKKKQQQGLREKQQAADLAPFVKASVPNACSPFDTVEEECAGRFKAVAGQAHVLRQQLPVLLRRLSKSPEPRHLKKTKHQLTVLMIYGILVFVLQYTSRRQANGGITHPMIEQNLRLLFPELEHMPHADTLFRLVRRIDVQAIEQAQIELVNQLIRKKKFMPLRVNNCYPIAIDGTQKLAGLELWSEELLQRRIPSSSDKEASDKPSCDEESVRYKYSIYVLEANLSFRNGMVIPLMTEFLNYQEGDSERKKQDCETRAFHRLAKRIKQAFPRLPVMLLLDGLYAQAPVMERCQDYHWQFMIVLKNGSLPTAWEEYHSLLNLQPGNEHRQNWGERRQHFRWANHIRYEYGPNANRHLAIHVVVCDEQWEVVNEHNEIVTTTGKQAWISSRPLNPANVHERCNLAARYRWGIESNFLVEKHQGYAYEHLFAKDWNAMRGYHYLMRLGHLINTLARFSSELAPMIRRMGVRPFLEFVRTTLSGPWLDLFGLDEVAQCMRQPFRLRFV